MAMTASDVMKKTNDVMKKTKVIEYGYLVDLVVATLIICVFLTCTILRLHIRRSRFLVKTSRAAFFILLARLSGSLILARFTLEAVVKDKTFKTSVGLAACFTLAANTSTMGHFFLMHVELFILSLIAILGPDLQFDDEGDPTHFFNKEWAVLACILRATGIFSLMFLDLNFYVMVAIRAFAAFVDQTPDLQSFDFLRDLNTVLHYDMSPYSSEFWNFWQYLTDLFVNSDGIEPFVYYLKYDFFRWLDRQCNEFLAQVFGLPAPSFTELCPAQNINTCLSPSDVHTSLMEPNFHFYPYFSVSQIVVMKIHELIEEFIFACVTFTSYVARGLINHLPNIPIN
jgi:hypothetical protein